MASTFKLFADKMGGRSASTYIGTTGEVFYDITGTTPLRLSDGVTPGGIPFGITNTASTFNPQFKDANNTFAGASLITGDYVLQGLICHFHIDVIFSGTTEYGDSQYQITLPFPSHTTWSTTNGILHQVGSGGGSGANTRYHIAGHIDTGESTTIMKLWYSGGTSDLAWKFNTPGGTPNPPNGDAYWAVAGDAHFNISGAYQIAL